MGTSGTLALSGVSGLNHAAHKAAFKKDIRGRLIKAGIEPDDIPDYSTTDLYEFAIKVFPDLMADTNNPQFMKRESIVETDEDGNMQNYDGMTRLQKFNDRGCINFRVDGPIEIAKGAFSSNFHLAATVGHELWHAWNCVNGSNSNWWYSSGGSDRYRADASELSSQNWELSNGVHFSVQQNINRRQLELKVNRF